MWNLGQPTYKQMIKMLHEAQNEAMKSGLYTGNVLYDIFKRNFPTAQTITRPCRLLKAAERIEAPLRNVHTNPVDQLQSYFDKVWIPKIGVNKSKHAASNIYDENYESDII